MNIASLSTIRVSKHFLPAHNLLPNSEPSQKPLLIYHAVFQHGTTAQGSIPPAAIESHLIATGVVVPQWRYTMYPTTHFHSTTHEVLCVSSGRATLCFGGEDNPQRVEATVEAGDAMVVPAGVAHRLLDDNYGGFEMVGSYPKGCQWDMCYGKAIEKEKVKDIGKVPWFDQDPIFGSKGPALDV